MKLKTIAKKKKINQKNFEQFEESMKQKYPDFSKTIQVFLIKQFVELFETCLNKCYLVLKNMEEKINRTFCFCKSWNHFSR